MPDTVDTSIIARLQPPPDPIKQMLGAQQVAGNQLELQGQRMAMAGQQAVKNVFADPANLGPDGNLKPEALAAIYAADPKAGMAIQQFGTQQQKAKLDIKGKESDLYVAKAQNIEDSVRMPSLTAYQRAMEKMGDPRAAQEVAQKVYSDGMKNVVGSGLFSEQEVAQMPTNFDFDRVLPASQKYLAFQEKQRADKIAERTADRADKAEAATERYQSGSLGLQAGNLALSRDRLNWEKNKPSFGTVQNVEVKGPDGKVTEVPAQQDARTGAWYTADQKRTLIENPGRIVHPSVYGEGATWDPDAVALAVQENIVSGTNPQFGGGNAGAQNRAAYQAERARLQKASGLSPGDFAVQVASGRGEIKSDLISLNQLTKMYDGTVAFEETMKANMKNALDLMPKAGTTEFGPFVNKVKNYIESGSGDPDIKAFGGALTSSMSEFAKIMGGGAMSSAALTEGARTEAMRMLSAADSPRAIKKFYEDVMLVDAENKKREYLAQRDAIKDRIKGVKMPSQDQAPGAPSPTGEPKTPKGGRELPQPLAASKDDLDYSPSRNQYRNRKTGVIYDASGVPVQ